MCGRKEWPIHGDEKRELIKYVQHQSHRELEMFWGSLYRLRATWEIWVSGGSWQGEIDLLGKTYKAVLTAKGGNTSPCLRNREEAIYCYYCWNKWYSRSLAETGMTRCEKSSKPLQLRWTSVGFLWRNNLESWNGFQCGFERMIVLGETWDILFSGGRDGSFLWRPNIAQIPAGLSAIKIKCAKHI